MTDNGTRSLTVDQRREVFGDWWDPERARQARAKWGRTDQWWAEHAERGAQRSPEQWKVPQGGMTDLEGRLGAAVRGGSGTGLARGGRPRRRPPWGLLALLHPPTVTMQVCLGRMYEASAGAASDFAEHYEAVAPGLTSWLRQATDTRARVPGVDPDTAQRE